MPIIQFHVYQHTARCTVHARHPFNENKHCQLYEASIDTKFNAKLYTRKELVMMKSSIVEFHQVF